MSGFEANFDGTVGPTHHYAGLSVGNEASQNNRDGLSNPKKAALQGLYKMKARRPRLRAGHSAAAAAAESASAA